MTTINPAEVSDIIKKQIEGFNTETQFDEVGTVLTIGDGIARIYGMQNVEANGTWKPMNW